MASQRKNIAVCGAGVMGLSAGFALSRSNHNVTIFDPAGSSSLNASAMAGGMLAPYCEIEHMPPAFVRAGLESIKFWQDIFPDVISNGSLLIAHPEDHHMLERFATHLPENIGERLNNAELQKYEPGLNKFSNALYLPQEAHLDPQSAMRFLAGHMQDNGVRIMQDICIAPEDFDAVIDCRGFAAAADDQGLRGVKGETLLVRNTEFTLSRPVRLMHPRYPLYIVPRADHVFMIGATVIEGAGHDSTCVRSALELLSAAYSLHSSFGDAEIIDIRAGTRPAYANNLPRIKIDGTRISCNGLFRHGFLLAPVMAQGVADYIGGKNNTHMALFKGGADERHDQRRQKDISQAA